VLYERYLIGELINRCPCGRRNRPRRKTKGRIVAAVVVLLSTLLITTGRGQALAEDSSWYREIGRPYDGYSGFDFTKYSKEEITTAKAKFLQVESDKSLNEWEGLYSRQTMLGQAELIWSSRHGFVYAYVYHTLASIDFGRVVLQGDSILLVSERKPARGVSTFINGEHIRVKLGERHFLVERSRLKDFAIFAAGLEVPEGRRSREIYTEEGFFWWKVGDETKQIADVPVFPTRYASLVRKPIRSRVVAVGRVRVKRTKPQTSDRAFIDHLRSITLSGGSRQGVRVGMTFWIDELEERVEVVSVRSSQSVAQLSRSVDDGREHCHRYENNSQVTFACREPAIGMTARTRQDHF
jgi:hypothetical protein